MRIYNAKRAQIEMPLSNGTKLVIPGHSISGEFMPNSQVISVFMSSYRPTEVAFVISGPFEISMLSNFAGSGEYVVSSLEEAVARFAPKADPTTTTTTPAPEEKLIPEIELKNEGDIIKKEEKEPVIEQEPITITTVETVTEEKRKETVSKKKGTTTPVPEEE